MCKMAATVGITMKKRYDFNSTFLAVNSGCFMTFSAKQIHSYLTYTIANCYYVYMFEVVVCFFRMVYADEWLMINYVKIS